MALTKSDREWLELKMGETVNAAVDPISKLVEKHHQSLYGPNNDNGLTGDMKTVKSRVTNLESIKNRALGYALGASTAVTGIWHGISSLFKG